MDDITCSLSQGNCGEYNLKDRGGRRRRTIKSSNKISLWIFWRAECVPPWFPVLDSLVKFRKSRHLFDIFPLFFVPNPVQEWSSRHAERIYLISSCDFSYLNLRIPIEGNKTWSLKRKKTSNFVLFFIAFCNYQVWFIEIFWPPSLRWH